MVKQPAIDGIKKALRNFEARVIRQQAGIVLFHPQQKFGIGIFTIGNAAQLFDDQADMVIVKVNTLLHRLLDGMPVSLFKSAAGRRKSLQENDHIGRQNPAK
ncbi:Uncharacterised protein [Klebsiella grimontii]|uniref:Uncharacterized protein n=1 Tax=Klebsiella grimontii TaxID=2058152 RepID=A0A7H4PC68_9ENTR|nr:Uncharacterised protein [Klebsiella grimontii]